jgi:hypothetical protein
VFGRATSNSGLKKVAPLQFFPAKHLSSENSKSTKIMDLAPNSTKSMEYLKGYSAKAGFVPTRGVGWKLPTFATRYTIYRFNFFPILIVSRRLPPTPRPVAFLGSSRPLAGCAAASSSSAGRADRRGSSEMTRLPPPLPRLSCGVRREQGVVPGRAARA